MSAQDHSAHHGPAAESTGEYTLTIEPPRTTDASTELRFRVLGPHGDAVRSFRLAHEKEVHFIVVRRDLTGFWHLHPHRVDAEVWAVRSERLEPGEYRVFADLEPSEAGHPLTLDADLIVAGPAERRPLPPPATTYDEYEVELDGELRPGTAGRLVLTVRRNGRPVTDLQPYLGSFGHLVAIRDGDLAYLHVHPDGSPGDGLTPSGPNVGFLASVSAPGTYRLFLDFRHRDVVRTAEFTVVTPA